MNNERWDEATEGGRPAKELFSTAWDDFRSYGYQDLKALREDLLERANAIREKMSSLEGDLQERVDKMIERWEERGPRRRAKWFFTVRARAAGALVEYIREKGPPPAWNELPPEDQEEALGLTEEDLHNTLLATLDALATSDNPSNFVDDIAKPAADVLKKDYDDHKVSGSGVRHRIENHVLPHLQEKYSDFDVPDGTVVSEWKAKEEHLDKALGRWGQDLDEG